MNRLIRLLMIALGATLSSHGGEITVELRPMVIEKSIPAVALPAGDLKLLQVEPKTWQDFQISEVASHGQRVKAGDILVRFDAESIDHKLSDTRRGLATAKLNLAQSELDLQHLQETVPHQLDTWHRSAEIAREENTYFTKVRRKAAEEGAAQALDKKKQTLSNQKEELRQLAKMYAADDVTEETEEIILTRQKDAVISAEFALRMEELDYKRSLEVSLPREAVNLANQQRDFAIKLRKAEAELPRSIELKKLEVDALRITIRRATEDLAKLESDRAQFEIKAPADGWFYYGTMENGRWNAVEAVKSVFKHGRPLVNRPFASFVPATARLEWTSFVDDATARALEPKLAGIATLAGRDDLEMPVTLRTLASIPGPDGNYRADFTAEWPKDVPVVAGATAQLRLICYSRPSACVVPTRALKFTPDGWTVEVKLADGKTTKRPVKRGRSQGDLTEIREGLEKGQVLIVPDDAPRAKP